MMNIKPILLPCCILLGLASACDTAAEESALEERLIDMGIEDEELLGELTAELTHEQLDALEVELDDAASGQLAASTRPAALELDACSAAFSAAGYGTHQDSNETVAGFARFTRGLVTIQARAAEQLRCQMNCTNENVCDAEESYYEYRYLGPFGGLPASIHFCACID